MFRIPKLSIPKINLFDSSISRALIYLLILLILLPLAFSFFVAGFDFEAKMRTVFLLQKVYIFTAFSVLILIFLVRPKKFELIPFNKSNAKFALLSILLFAALFYTQLDINPILVEGVELVQLDKETTIDLDASRLIAHGALDDHVPVAVHLLNRKGEFFLKRLRLDAQPTTDTEIKFLAVWQGGPDSEFNSQVSLIVNDNEFDISQYYAGLEKNQIEWLAVNVPASFFKSGLNTITLRKDNGPAGERIGLLAQATYFTNDSFISGNGGYRALGPYHEYIMFVNKPNNILFSTLFKFGFVFKILGLLFLFLAVFGLNFLKQIIFNAKKEFAFSTFFAYAVYWFGTFLQGYWQFFSFIVTTVIYNIYKVLMLNPVMNLNNPNLPRLGINGFVVSIADICSGVESMAYFLIAYTALIIFNWHRISLRRALILYIPGLLGVFIVNIIRVALILLIGAYYNKEFAINTFHTNAAMFLFIIYFVIFWPLVMKFIRRD
ncbi:MAG: hypothetical protein CL943_00315 [Candidatus Diapherotrites archaeon]|uniref:Exosortase/archaeosortase family protein n=1 Tax=Candidatus Iainarchaeum sp. TaxID=3101447 RepID=A0A2D6LZY8_9ARCH|nr:hypothetical protein [Candidatus Diapherotrites archaeon]|tara:strand:+ start:7073 stop:8548 length:1476 start_codon:yes stop_codon:yes gene_type:complete